MTTNRAVALREAFDRSFAEAPGTDSPVVADLLRIEVGSQPYALRLTDISGLGADRPVSRVWTPVRAFLGFAGLRGRVVPVFDLRPLLGHAPEAADVPRWMVTLASAPVALAFDGFGGHLRVPGNAVAPADAGSASRPHLREIVRENGRNRPIVDVDSVLADIRVAAPPRGTQ